MGSSATQVQNTNYYKVFVFCIANLFNWLLNSFFNLKISFLEVLELVKSRRTFVKNGFAYVTILDFGSVLTHAFRTRLSKGLSVGLEIFIRLPFKLIPLLLKQTLSRYVKEVEEDQRVSDLLKILRERDVAENYGDTQTRDHLTAESLDSVNN